MKNLIEKELNLNIPILLFSIPLLSAILLLIPQWIYVIAFMYFFWITVPSIYGMYNSQRDLTFTQMLPVRKKDIVVSKIFVIVLIQLLHIVLGIIFAIIRNQIYGTDNFALELNIAFFGMIFILFALFNITFFPTYFKTAYHYGIPLIIASIITTLYAAMIELLNGLSSTFNTWIKAPEYQTVQLGILIFGILFYVLTTLLATKISVKRFSENT